MKIKPTIQMIESDQHGAWNCPYAQAIIAACPSLSARVRVSNLSTRIGKKTITNPTEMVTWIIAYDLRASFLIMHPQSQRPPLGPAPEVDLPVEEFCT